MIKTLVIEKTLSTLAEIHSEGIQPAYFEPSVINAAFGFLEKNTVLVFTTAVEDINGKRIREHDGVSELCIDLFNALNAFLIAQPAAKPIGIIRLQHDFFFYVAAAGAAVLAGENHTAISGEGIDSAAHTIPPVFSE